MPTNRTASRTAIASIVEAAFLASVGLNAGTPLAIASVPVSATEPLANARSSRKIPIGSVASSIASGCRGHGAAVPLAMATTPLPTMNSAMPMNRYVGMAKMLPDSRRPRRLATVIRAMATSAISTRSGFRFGDTEISWSTADEVETATVMT